MFFAQNRFSGKERSSGLKRNKASRPILCALALAGACLAQASLAADKAQVYFISPQNGDVLSNPITVKFGLSGMGVAPAGIEVSNTGHHHLLIDVAEPPRAGTTIPADDRHRHFGGGQTETTLNLSPGEHTLQLLVGDHLHRPHDTPVMSEKITITVK
ncbi:DUF4399 domain-containing protein [Gilvimarinus algae]|uniref:DUF4399 domain-containing protein n=1 Tax=Gilvimarinus algae TaxID=3058037 RepID=A0ABT8TH22_9GAMM|nr:DUF4399 domain-containing protein [Gilvimarinus sp. SDUM040014]MDO3383399.1 DUF4399 domain-containing protein [Gilvimarinus sp. SDUM040014]